MNEKKLNIIDYVVDSVYCIGDIHGNFNALKGFIRQKDIHKSLLIVCGDCGLGFEKNKHYTQTVFPELLKTLTTYDDYLVFIHGNHDNPDLFNSNIFNYDRLNAIPDYTILNIFYDEDKCAVKHSILCIGGATSIDRTYRIKVMEENARRKMIYSHCSFDEAYEKTQKLYWDNEAPVYNEEILKLIDKTVYPIDIVCTHTAPSFCDPQMKNGIEYWLTKDEKLSDDLDKERKVFDNIYDFLMGNGFTIEKWCYGHFHKHHTEYINGVKFCLLDMDRGGRLDYEYTD